MQEKTLTGKFLAEKLSATFIDKDTVSNHFTSCLLSHFSQPKNDRHSDIYKDNIKELEYTTMMDIAIDNLSLNNHVICVAPFITELQNQPYVDFYDVIAEANNAELIICWVYTGEHVLKDRMINRNSSLDEHKLLDWEHYYSSVKDIKPTIKNKIHFLYNSPDSTVPFIDSLNVFAKTI